VSRFSDFEQHKWRALKTYAASLGLDRSLEGFLAVARQQSRLGWRQDLTANAVNSCIKAGFE
jgi:hypothetical protein